MFILSKLIGEHPCESLRLPLQDINFDHELLPIIGHQSDILLSFHQRFPLKVHIFAQIFAFVLVFLCLEQNFGFPVLHV